jgi:hypothetical protein
LFLNFRERAVSRHREEGIKAVFKLYPSVKKRAGNSVFIHFPARFFFALKTVPETVRVPKKSHQKQNNQEV